jgi:hypothetical protein
MEWLIVLAVVGSVIWWSSRKPGMDGRVWRMVFRLVPRPTIDSRLLPRALAVGIGLGVVGMGLHAAGYHTPAIALGLVIGPFAGGQIVGSGWWVLVAVVTSVPLAAGDELRPTLVALPVALIAFVGTRVDWRGRPRSRRRRRPSSEAGPLES